MAHNLDRLTANQKALILSILNAFKKDAIGKQIQIYGRVNKRYLKLGKRQKLLLSDKEILDLAGKGYIAIFSTSPKRLSLQEKALDLEGYSLPVVASWIEDKFRDFIGEIALGIAVGAILYFFDKFIVEKIIPSRTNLLWFYLVPILVVSLGYKYFSKQGKSKIPFWAALLITVLVFTLAILPHLTSQ